MCILGWSLWSGYDWKDYFPPAEVEHDANFGQKWWHQKLKKGQGSSRPVTGGTGGLMKFNLISSHEKTSFKKKKNKLQCNRDFETLSLAKNRDSETPSYKKRDCETHIIARKTRPRDLWNSTKIMRDPQFLKDYSPPLWEQVSWPRAQHNVTGPQGSNPDLLI